MGGVLGERTGPCSKQATRSSLVNGFLVKWCEMEWEVGRVGVGICGGFLGTGGLGLLCGGEVCDLGQDGRGGGSEGGGLGFRGFV